MLDWHKIQTTEDLLTIRMKQLAALAHDRRVAAGSNKESCIKAAQDFAKRNMRRLFTGTYPQGTMVLVYQAKFDVNAKFHGAKYRDRWAGPFRVHRHLKSGSYQLLELDGTRMKGSVAANRVKKFYNRDRRDNKEIVDLQDDLTDSDELGLQAITISDEDYMPSAAIIYGRDPNLLTSYRRQTPDWEEVWNRWKKRQRRQASCASGQQF
jgi:hypothetical protein